MKKKYIISLILISILFLVVLTISTGYGLWIATNGNKEKSSITLNCFKVYLSSNEIIEMHNIDSVVNEEGIESSPYTLTITNVCEEKKELQVRLNILNDSTVDINALTIQAAGNIEKETTLYKNLTNAKSREESVTQSKIIGLLEVAPNETVRTNIKIWFDEKKAPSIDPEVILRAKFELIDTESSIKATFAESLLTNTAAIEAKGSPTTSQAAYQEEGLFSLSTEEGKTYYYRGIVNNNYVKFANLIWRIVRINPDYSVRLILDKSAMYNKYSANKESMDYTGLKYIYNDQPINNNITQLLEEWYQNNITPLNLDKYITTTSICNDSNNKTENYHTYFAGYNRLVTTINPTVACTETSADFGGKYNMKIGLISADEVALAGGLYKTNNQNFYLYNGENFFTSTPAEFYNYNAFVFMVNNSGAIETTQTNTEYGIRPVISLNSTVTVSGSGTINDPYTIDTDE